VRAWPRRRSRLQIVLALAVGAGLGLLVGLRLGWIAGLAAGLPVAGGYYWLVMRRFLRRRRLVREPFPEAWRAPLNRCVGFYRGLDQAGRARFENDIRFFLAEQRIYGPRGAPVDDEIRVLAAAGAAMLGHGLPDWEWPRLRDIVVYPAAFDSEYRVGRGKGTLGMVHHQGPIIFSADDLRLGFCNPEDGLNVGLHELAHVMDLEDGAADGVPAGLGFVAAAPWLEVVADRLKKVRKGRRRRVLRRYAGTNEAELFAVAVEVFFEKPDRLKQRDPELYEMLAGFFNQDPAGSKG